MAKNPEDRYASASELALDIERFGQDEPVLAAPSTAAYRLGKGIKKNRAIAGAPGATLTVLAVAVVVILAMYVRVESALVRSEGLRLTARASALSTSNPVLSLRLGIEGASLRPCPVANSTRLHAPGNLRERKTVDAGTRLTCAEFSPDGRHVPASGDNGVAGVWEVSRGAKIPPPLDEETVGLHATYSRDGSRILTVSSDGSLRVRDTEDGELLVLAETGRRLRHGAFGPWGLRVAAASLDGTIEIWDAVKESRAPILTLPGLGGESITVEFKRDGSRIVSAGTDQFVTIRDAVSSEHSRFFPTRTDLCSATFSPEADRVLSASSSATMAIWEVTTGKQDGLEIKV